MGGNGPGLNHPPSPMLGRRSGALQPVWPSCPSGSLKPWPVGLTPSGPQLERSPLLHIGFHALDSFQASAGRLPEPGSEEDAAAVIAAAKSINDAAADKVRASVLALLLLFALLLHCHSQVH